MAAEAVRKKRNTVIPVIRCVLGLVFFLCLLAALGWVALCCTVQETGAAGIKRVSPPSFKVESFMADTKKQALDELTYVRKIYRLEENATIAPQPDPSGYGVAATYSEFLPVLEAAAELLDGETPILDADTPLMEDYGIHYYFDESILAFVWRERQGVTICTFAEVRLGHPTQLIRKLGGDAYGSSIQKFPSELARETNAVLALNGDFYRFQNTGIHVYQRNVYTWDGARVDTCFVDSAGDFRFVKAGELMGESEVRGYVEENDILFSMSFGPVMVENGRNVVPEYYWMGQSRDYYARSCISQVGPLHYLMMTVYMGSTVWDAAEWMIAKGCTNAYAVDGGQSATIVLDGQQVNPSQFDSERTLSDVLCFVSAVSRD